MAHFPNHTTCTHTQTHLCVHIGYIRLAACNRAKLYESFPCVLRYTTRWPAVWDAESSRSVRWNLRTERVSENQPVGHPRSIPVAPKNLQSLFLSLVESLDRWFFLLSSLPFSRWSIYRSVHDSSLKSEAPDALSCSHWLVGRSSEVSRRRVEIGAKWNELRRWLLAELFNEGKRCRKYMKSVYLYVYTKL